MIDCSNIPDGVARTICEHPERYGEARWRKVMQHFVDSGMLEVPENATITTVKRSRTPQKPAGGVGTELTKMISWFADIRPDKSSCSCNRLANEMDRKGPEWCRRKRDKYIVPKILANRELLSEELKNQKGWKGLLAQAAGILPEPMLRKGAQVLVDRAIEAVPKPQRHTRKRSKYRRARKVKDPGKKREAFPFPGEPRLTLLCHCWPRSGWRRHVDMVAPVKDRFHRRILGIATDENTASADEVKEAFGDGWEFVEVENKVPRRRKNGKPKEGLREVATYNKMLRMVESKDPNHVTVCIHCKGAKTNTSIDPNITWWTDAMYETVLYNLDEVLERMANGASLVGSFQLQNNQFKSRYGHFYAGTFYAFRNARAFENEFPKYRQAFWGTESWPGDHFCLAECENIFGADQYDLYHIQPREELERWKQSR